MKIILDTNCLLVVLPQNSPYRCLWDAFRRKEFILCYSTEILQEYEELLFRFCSFDTAFLTMEIKFVDCALNAGADFIVTNDKHFSILKEIEFPKINVVSIDIFKETIINIK